MTQLRGSLQIPWRRALVTGASNGLGREFARRLASNGCDLVIVARRHGLLDELATELRTNHQVVVEVLAADLGESDQLGEVIHRIRAGQSNRVRGGVAPGVLDLVVNNAGSGEPGDLASRPVEARYPEVTVNVGAVVALTRAAIDPMRAQGHGAILNVSSGVGFYPVPSAALYGASKAFVTSFGEAVAHELRGTGVTITTVCPGFTATGAPAQQRMRIDRVPRVLWMEPEEVVGRALRAAASGKTVTTPGSLNRAGAFLGRHLPHRVLVPVVAAMQRRLAT